MCSGFQADPPNKAGRKLKFQESDFTERAKFLFQADPPNKAGRKSSTVKAAVELQNRFQADPPNKAGRKPR